MLAVPLHDNEAVGRVPAGAEPAPQRALVAGGYLFQAGDTRARLYRVEQGALCHYMAGDADHHEVIEFAFPGDIIGFGHMEKHVSTARAMVETIVSVVSPAEFSCALEIDGQLAARFAAAADREFDYMRERAIRSGAGEPVKRVAAFLSAVSHIGAREGRDPTLITDELSSGFVADQLGMSIDRLQSALIELERRGVVRASKEGLRIASPGALEDLARVA
jgi:CRP/FNR family transcriptional regulator